MEKGLLPTVYQLVRCGVGRVKLAKTSARAINNRDLHSRLVNISRTNEQSPSPKI